MQNMCCRFLSDFSTPAPFLSSPWTSLLPPELPLQPCLRAWLYEERRGAHSGQENNDPFLVHDCVPKKETIHWKDNWPSVCPCSQQGPLTAAPLWPSANPSQLDHAGHLGRLVCVCDGEVYFKHQEQSLWVLSVVRRHRWVVDVSTLWSVRLLHLDKPFHCTLYECLLFICHQHILHSLTNQLDPFTACLTV